MLRLVWAIFVCTNLRNPDLKRGMRQIQAPKWGQMGAEAHGRKAGPGLLAVIFGSWELDVLGHSEEIARGKGEVGGV